MIHIVNGGTVDNKTSCIVHIVTGCVVYTLPSCAVHIPIGCVVHVTRNVFFISILAVIVLLITSLLDV